MFTLCLLLSISRAVLPRQRPRLKHELATSLILPQPSFPRLGILESFTFTTFAIELLLLALTFEVEPSVGRSSGREHRCELEVVRLLIGLLSTHVHRGSSRLPKPCGNGHARCRFSSSK